jgi:predicted RND superfamily exporter protein
MHKRFRFRVVMSALFLFTSAVSTATLTPANITSRTNQKCPEISITCPTEELTGGRDTYAVSVKLDSAREPETLTFQWAVSEGIKIVEGQGMRSIKIQVSHLCERNTATVYIYGLDDGCDSTESCTFSVCS